MSEGFLFKNDDPKSWSEDKELSIMSNKSEDTKQWFSKYVPGTLWGRSLRNSQKPWGHNYDHDNIEKMSLAPFLYCSEWTTWFCKSYTVHNITTDCMQNTLQESSCLLLKQALIFLLKCKSIPLLWLNCFLLEKNYFP